MIANPTSTVDGHFDGVLADGRCWLELSGGRRIELPVSRWRGAAIASDELLLGPCLGPSLDVGCGPGRLTAELTARGVAALGIDTSPQAVEMTRARGAAALRRDVFELLPGEGGWQHVLLADGNVGIGGDPVALLHRVARLLAPAASALVEVEPPGAGVQRGAARVGGAGSPGAWFAWARVGADAIADVAARAGLRAASVRSSGGRYVAALTRA